MPCRVSIKAIQAHPDERFFDFLLLNGNTK